MCQSRWDRRPTLCCEGKRHPHDGTLARLTDHIDLACTMLHHAIDCGKPQSYIQFLCREKWLKHVRLGLRTHSTSGIAHFDQRCGPMHSFSIHRLTLMPMEYLLRFNPKPTPLRHGISGIHRQMKQRLLKALTIDLYFHRRIFNDQIEINGWG